MIQPMPLSTPLSTLNHRHVSSSVSTNSELIDAIKNGSLSAQHPQLLTADTQTAGRGQRGRSWQSPRGNVYLSLYHPMQAPVSGLLSLVIGVELTKMPIITRLNTQLSAQNLPTIGVKWANDLGFYQPPSHALPPIMQTDTSQQAPLIYFNKLVGILIEPVWCAATLVGVVMGVGLNVETTPKLTTQTCEGMSYQALSLQDLYQTLHHKAHHNANIHHKSPLNLPNLTLCYAQIGHALVRAIATFERLMSDKPSAHNWHLNNFMHDFAQVDALAGLALQVTQNHHGEPHHINGHACGIDTQGCLQLKQDNGNISALFTGRIDVMSALLAE